MCISDGEEEIEKENEGATYIYIKDHIPKTVKCMYMSGHLIIPVTIRYLNRRADYVNFIKVKLSVLYRYHVTIGR